MNLLFMQIRQHFAQQVTQCPDVTQHSFAGKLFIRRNLLREAESDTLCSVGCTGVTWRQTGQSSSMWLRCVQPLTVSSIALASLLSSGMRNVTKCLVLGDTRILMDERSATERRKSAMIEKKVIPLCQHNRPLRHTPFNAQKQNEGVDNSCGH